jgi:hypothetical protein
MQNLDFRQVTGKIFWNKDLAEALSRAVEKADLAEIVRMEEVCAFCFSQ